MLGYGFGDVFPDTGMPRQIAFENRLSFSARLI